MASGAGNGPPAGCATLPTGPAVADAGGAPLVAAAGLLGAAEPLLPHPASRPQASSAAPPGLAVASSRRPGRLDRGSCGRIMGLLRFLAVAAVPPGGGDRTSGTATGR